jgi:plasmid stability protein
MATIQVKNLPDQTVRTLKVRAAKAGKSLQEYMRTHLIDEASKPTVEELFAEIEARPDDGARLDPDLTLASIRDARESL